MNGSIYTMTCGCQLEDKELIRKKGKNICKYHSIGRSQGRIRKIERSCCDCQKKMTLTQYQQNQIRCPECRAEKKKDIDLAYYHDNKQLKKPNQVTIKKAKKKPKKTKIDVSLYAQGLSRYLIKD